MKCPHCGNELELAHAVERNVETYGDPAIATTSCCSKPVTVFPINSYYVKPYTGPRTEDDWGNPIKR